MSFSFFVIQATIHGVTPGHPVNNNAGRGFFFLKIRYLCKKKNTI